MDLSELQSIRLEKADTLRERGVSPYPTRAHRTHTAAQGINLFETEEQAAALDESGHTTATITVAGRIVSYRHMGKTVFAHLRDGEGQIQLYLRRDLLGDEGFQDVLKLIDVGDFVEATGDLFRTRTGEVSLRASSFTMLAKALNAPPEKWHGLTDIEVRYRQRYVDLLASEETRHIFRTRSRVVSSIRRFFEDRGFLEVETPVLQPLYGGAAARPFTTHHNALDQTFYLRIAVELYLKRLIVGGFDRVFELTKDFRNEGMDRNHQPEFTMLEWYQAYSDYEDQMTVVEDLISTVVKEVHGGTTFPYKGETIDVTTPWPRKTLREAILEKTGIDFMEHKDADDLIRLAREKGADIETGTVWPRVVDELLKQFVRPYLIQPTILTDYPVELSPLAKRRDDDPAIAERFQPYIGGGEIGNAFTELNDPMDQLARFMDQQKDREAGDEEAMPIDEDFVTALMYGMPPTGGVGIGIDRLVMLLTDQDTIRDVMLFPAMRNRPASASPDSTAASTTDPN